MPPHLTRKAARTYLTISKWSFFAGLISWSQLMERLVALRMLCVASDPIVAHALRVLKLEEYSVEDDWPFSEGGPSVQTDSDLSSLDGHSAERGDDEDNGYFYFCPSPLTGLAYWEFRLYDDDFFPSVPHGHKRDDQRTKLDAYLGWIYQRSRQIDREPRSKIIALWNDHDFREVARRSIDYFLENHLYYTGWQVANPRKLPRRR